jgi:hypothetical protein
MIEFLKENIHFYGQRLNDIKLYTYKESKSPPSTVSQAQEPLVEPTPVTSLLNYCFLM